jgi:hypothetical protein
LHIFAEAADQAIGNCSCKEGGLRERMTKARIDERNKKK